MKRFCQRCLFYDGMRLWLHPRTLPPAALPIRVDATGVCSVCQLYARAYDRDSVSITARDLSLAAEPVIALYSGGKDSTAALAYAKSVMRLDVHALLFDNGLIPKPVIERADEVCERLGTPLYVVTRDDLPSTLGLPSVQDELKAVSDKAATPCISCAGHVLVAAAELSKRLRASWLIQGTNYFTHWDETPHADRYFEVAGRLMHAINLPYALGWTSHDMRQQLAAVGFEELELKGVSSNCVVPGLVQAKIARSLGHVPELEDLSLEVIVGHLTRASALAELTRKAPDSIDLVTDAL